MADEELLRIEAEDEAVWARTMKAVDDAGRAATQRSIRIRCGECGATIAHVDVTTFGPLFTSSWETSPDPAVVATMKVARKLNWPAERLSEREGTIALLALPPEIQQDYPDLLARCGRHGDVVLSRTDVLARLRSKDDQDIIVGPTKPRRRYRPMLHR